MRPRTGLIALLAVVASATAQAQTLSQYDVFVFQDFRLTTSEVNGNIAIGRNATLTNWREGHTLAPASSDFSPAAGNKPTSHGGSGAAGRPYVWGTARLTKTGFAAACSPQSGGPP